jgi:hypothetical protein
MVKGKDVADLLTKMESKIKELRITKNQLLVALVYARRVMNPDSDLKFVDDAIKNGKDEHGND